MRAAHYKFLMIIFVVAVIGSGISSYYVYQVPNVKKEDQVVFTYLHVGDYNYTAKLTPNLYYNKTTLRAGEGRLFTSITKEVDINFVYNFTTSLKPEELSINHGLDIRLESPKRWNKTLSSSEMNKIFWINDGLDFSMRINTTSLEKYMNLIDEEVGVRSTDYYVFISPRISVNALINSRKLNDIFTPTLKISYLSATNEGSYISIDDLHQNKFGNIVETKNTRLEWVDNQRYLSIALFTASIIVMSLSAYMYIKTRPKDTRSKVLEKITSKYKEGIVNSQQVPTEMARSMEFESFEDLYKVSELMSRPIIHYKDKNQHIFYVIDDSTKYHFSLKI